MCRRPPAARATILLYKFIRRMPRAVRGTGRYIVAEIAPLAPARRGQASHFPLVSSERTSIAGRLRRGSSVIVFFGVGS